MSLILREASGGGVPVGTLDTDVLVQRLPGRASSLVRLPIALDPATPVDQAFNINGYAAQVYHFSDHVRVVTALVPGDVASWPRTPTCLKVAQGEGATPSEAGTFPSLDLSGMEAILTIDGVQFLATLDDAIHEDKVAPIGPGHRNQSGPDLLRRKHYLLRLKRAGVEGAGTETTDYCTVADVSVTTRVDMDLAVVEILWMVGAWKGSNNPFAENPTCSGPVYFDSLHIPRTSLPEDYDVELFAPHPFQFVTVHNVVCIANMPSGEVHWAPTTAQCTARFAIWNPATVDQPTARKVLRYHDRGRAWSGPLSFHWNHAFGERLDVQIDLARWQTGTQGEEIPWRDPLFFQDSPAVAMDRIATEAANRHRIHWEAGTAFDPTFTGARKGWMHGHLDASVGGPGGGGIQGLSDNHQGRGWFEVTTMRLDGLASRLPLAMIDIEDGRALSDTTLAANNSSSWTALDGAQPGAAGKLPYQLTAGLTYGTWVHPHFVPADTDLSEYRAWRYPGSGGGLAAQLTLAPSTRSWNSPPSGKTCPYRDDINWQVDGQWGPYDLAHSSRAMSPLRDALWHLDDPIAHRLIEQYAQTRAMLGYARHGLSGYAPGRNNGAFAIAEANMSEIMTHMSSPTNQGYWRALGNTVQANTRNLAWAMQLTAMHWSVATSDVRAQIHPSGNGSWFRKVWQLCNLTFMENGFGHRTSEPYANPNPFNRDYFGATNVAQRTGAFPLNNGIPDTGASFVFGFQVAFLCSAIYSLKHGPLREDAAIRDQLDATIRLARPWFAQALTTSPSAALLRPTYFMPMSLDGSGVFDPPFTAQDIQNGAARWTLRIVGEPGQPAYVTENYTSCAAACGFRETQDPAFFDLVSGDFGVPRGNDLALFIALRDEHVMEYATQLVREQGSNDNAETTWAHMALAELIYWRNAIYHQ